MKEPVLFFNRELSWLKFNTRVLNESSGNIPLLDKLKFMAIYGTNLDEFYMVRVAGLKRLSKAGINKRSIDKMTPKEQLKAIREYIHNEKIYLEDLFNQVKMELEKENIFIKSFYELSCSQKEILKDYFKSYLYPIIIPVIVDSTHPFPHLNNLSFGIIVRLSDGDKNKFGMVRIPRMLPRLIEIDNVYIPIEMVVREFISDIFRECKLISYVPFRVTRDADIEVEEEEADDFMEIMAEGLKARNRGEVVRLEVGDTSDASLIDFITSHIKVSSKDIYKYSIPLNLNSLWQVINANKFINLNLRGENFPSKILPPLYNSPDILEIISNNDIALFHPYESFDPIIDFIQNAASDPDVYSIKMTLYRAGKNSPIVKALSQAAENNKQVTVLVELKARFDEENNLYWARALERAGAHVIYGIPGLKVHAKIALVIKKIKDEFKGFVHLSTGNYNPSTSKIYTDISYFTANKNIVNDAIELFHALSTGYARSAKLNSLFIAPTQIKPKILELINNEKKHGKNGYIIIKLNSIVDKDVIESLYDASKEGVKIDLIVRGICCLVPNIKGISENIRVISIIGKYLEHARIYYFKNSSPKIYFSSADLMPRNLERRVELMVPINNTSLEEKLLYILNLQLSDNLKSYELNQNGEYIKIQTPKIQINSQEEYEKYINESFTRLTKIQDSKKDRNSKIIY